MDRRKMSLANWMTAYVLILLFSITGARGQGSSQHGMGCKPSPASAFRSHARARIAASRDTDRPSQFTLQADLPPVSNQGHTGSCVGWSTAYYCYSTSVARERKLSEDERRDSKWLFSPSFIWHQFNNGQAEQGMYIPDAFDVLARQGCATMAEMPWTESDLSSGPSDEAKARAIKFKARETVALFKGAANGDAADPEKLRNWLWETKEPFVIGVSVYPDFMSVPSDPSFVYMPSDTSHRLGGHAICIVGYDDTKHAFLMVNSWGPGWGNNGFLWLSEDYITQCAYEGWGQRPGGPRARGRQITAHITFEPAQP